MKIHVTGGKRGDTRDVSCSIQGTDLDIINLIDALDHGADALGADMTSGAILAALRTAITDTHGLVAADRT